MIFMKILLYLLYNIFQSLSPGLVKTSIMEGTDWVEGVTDPDAPTLQAKDIADAVLYVLSTPPNVQVNYFLI